jgi:TetR/AcrR family transcriptional regulator, repressor for uid operon
MASSEKVTAREAKRLATRERLFTAAIAELKRSGVAAADVGAIVAEAGVAHGTFFFHFPTKEHALAELGHREEVRMTAELDRFLAEARDLRATLHEVVRMSGTVERRLGAVLFRDLLGLYFAPMRPELQLWPDHPLIARVVAEFERARDRGELRPDPGVDPASAAVFFLMGYFALQVTYERSAERDRMLEQNITVLLRGLGEAR